MNGNRYLGSSSGDQTPNKMNIFNTIEMKCACVHVSPTRDTRGPRGSGLDHGVTSVTLEHDLPTIADLANIRPANSSFLLAPVHAVFQGDLYS